MFGVRKFVLCGLSLCLLSGCSSASMDDLAMDAFECIGGPCYLLPWMTREENPVLHKPKYYGGHYESYQLPRMQVPQKSFGSR